jgi:hypothetical protein
MNDNQMAALMEMLERLVMANEAAADELVGIGETMRELLGLAIDASNED